MKKRVFSLLLAWLMMLTLLPANALATVEPEIKGTAYFGLSAETAKPGDTIIVKIMARDLPGVAGFAIRIAFDNTRLEAVKNGRSWTKYDENVSILKNNVTVYVDESAYNVSYSHAENGYENSGELFEIKFKVKEDAPAGDAILTMDTATVGDEGEKNVWTNAELQAYNPNYESATLTISGGVTPPQHTCSADTLTEIPAKAHTCTEDGNYKYYRCTCGELYEDADAKIPTTAEKVIDKAAHTDLKKTEAKKATCEENGNEAYWFCNGCNKYYTDNDNTVGTETTLEALTIKATGHDWEVIKGADGSSTHTLKCKSCNKTVDEVHADRRGDESKKWESNKDSHWNVYGCGTIMNKAAHTWNEGVVTTPATCTTAGEKTFTCKVCSETKTEPIAALGHAYGEPAWNWGEDGKTATATFTCANNSEHTSAVPAAITSTEKKAASCTEMGTTTYTATVTFEGKNYSATKDVEDIAKIAHTLTATPAKAATCTETGNNAYWTCDTCGQVFKDEQGTQPTTVDAETIKATGHTPKTDWTTDGDYHWHVCDKCGAVVGDKAAHTFNTNDCAADRKCTICSYEKKAGQHSWGEKTYTWSDDFKCTAATKCISCQKPLTETVDGVKTTVPATCVADGKDIYTATFTNTAFEIKTKEVTIDKLGHTYGAPVWSWSEDGKTATATFTCTREGCTAETTGHAQTVTATVSGKQKVAPTCTDKGTTTYTAKVTFETKDYTDTKDVQDIKALGHTLTKFAAKAATCTEAGNSEYYTCATCGKFFSDKDGKNEIAKDSWVIDALGHKLTETPAVTPTCAAGGNNEYWTCSVCHKVFKADKTTETTVAAETLAKDPANHTGGKELRGAVAASCMTAGREADTYCKGCGVRLIVGKLIDSTGNHNYVDGVCTTCGNKQPADNATIKAAIEKVVADVKEAVEEVLDKAIKNETDANTKKILEKLKGYVSGSSRSKLQAVYGVTMSLNGQDLGKGDSLADGQNVTIAISEETYNALRSGAKIVESYLDDKGEAQTREINATLKQVGDGYTVTFASDKTAVYGLMTRTSSGGSSGSGSSYTSGQSFTTDLPADSINRVTVNGKKLDSKYYTVSSNGSGSIVTLTDAYLATLKAGKYTVKIENKTHVSTGTFTIKADGTLSSPKTADAGIALYAMLAVSSLMGTAVVSKKRRKA